MKSFRSTAFFGILVLGFASYVYFFEFLKSQEEEVQAGIDKKVFSIAEKEIHKVEFFNRVLNQRLVLEKKDDEWNITTPINDLADSNEVISLLVTLTTSDAEEVVSGDEIDKAEYGLIKPDGEIIVSSAAGVAEKLVVGTVKSFNGKSYILDVNRSAVRLVDESVTQYIDRTADQFRDKQVFREKLSGVRELSFFTGEKQQYKLIKSGAGWRLENSNAPLDFKAVDRYIDALNDLRNKSFVSETASDKELNQFGLRKASHRFLVKTEKEERELRISRKINESAFVHNSARAKILEMPYATVTSLFKKKDAFKDKKAPFKFDQSKVKKIKLATKDSQLELRRSGDEWSLQEPISGKEINKEGVQSLLSQIQGMRADEFVGSAAKTGLESSENRIILAGGEGDSVLELVWGLKFKLKDSNEELFYVKSSRSSEIVGVKVSAIDSISADELLQPTDVKDAENEKSKK